MKPLLSQRKELQTTLMPEMQRGLFFLELPLEELELELRKEVDQNPLLECEEKESEEVYFNSHDNLSGRIRKRKEAQDTGSLLENIVPLGSSLFDTLWQQARETFEKERDLELAQAIIGNLDPGRAALTAARRDRKSFK